MVVVMKPNASKEDIAKLAAELEQLNLKVSITEGHGCSILGPVSYTHLQPNPGSGWKRTPWIGCCRAWPGEIGTPWQSCMAVPGRQSMHWRFPI